ncbi:MAG: ROK family protein [Emticicia sp.]|uniref:ROK family protein n=1 Tax=Emticicia sp. TaxID=1930953 RepID=UPI003BA7E5BE
MHSSNKHIGVDIGGSHITSALINSENGKVDFGSMQRVHVNSHDCADNILAQWTSAIENTIGSDFSKLSKIGIAMPGPFDYETGVCLMQNVNKYESLYGLNIKKSLAERLEIESEKIQFKNDAEAYLAGEMTSGAGVGYKKSIGLTIGTGLGTAIYENGKAKDLGLGFTYKFESGVIEEYVSTRWFLARYEELTNTKLDGVKAISSIYDSDKYAKQVYDEFSRHLTYFINEFISIFYPEVIVIGGNIANSFHIFYPSIQEFLDNHYPGIKVVKSKLGEQAALIGAINP